MKNFLFLLLGGLIYAQKVGINTETPSATLHINGDMRIRDIIEGNVNESKGVVNYSAIKTDIPLMWNEDTHEVVEGKRSSQTPFYIERFYGTTEAPDRAEVMTSLSPKYYDIVMTGISTIRKTKTDGQDEDKLVMENFTNYQVLGAPPYVDEGIMNPMAEKIAPPPFNQNANWQVTSKFVTGITANTDANGNIDFETGYSDPQASMRIDVLGMQWEYVSLLSLNEASTNQCWYTSLVKIDYNDAGGSPASHGICALDSQGVGGLSGNPIDNSNFIEHSKDGSPYSISKEAYWYGNNYSTSNRN